jgi:ubiquinone/menaquinone biosynthesis C-methylase UbiE
MTSRYDTVAEFYVAFVDRMLSDPDSFWHPLRALYTELLQNRLPGARVLDVACGEGHLSRWLGTLGPREVIGIDISAELLRVAAERTAQPNIHFRLDDAQTLGRIQNATTDIAVSNLALMDIPDHRALFGSVRRVLAPGGVFVCSLLHPCFQAPFHEPEAPQFIFDEKNKPVGYTIREYAQEGHWNSGGTGVRGRVGAYHRTLSTLINDLLAVGFQLLGLHEPLSGTTGLYSRVPRVLVIEAQAGG